MCGGQKITKSKQLSKCLTKNISYAIILIQERATSSMAEHTALNR